MLKKILVIMAICLMVSSVSFAQKVTLVGMGATASDAESDALRNAVETSIGVLVDSETMVKNFQVVKDEIYTKSRGFITNYTVTEKRESESGIWQVTINADVDTEPNSKLMNELTRLGIIDTKLRNPKIAVWIPERHIAYHVPDPAGETAVMHALLDAGFSNVIAASPAIPSHIGGKTIEDMRNLARFMDADILVMGEAFSEGMGDVGRYLPGSQRTGMQSCRARIEAKLYIAQTGQIIAADGKYASGMDISESIASKKALAAAGKQMGEHLSQELLTLGAGNHQGLEVIVNCRDFNEASRIQLALASSVGGGNIQLSAYDAGQAKFVVISGKSPSALFADIQRVCPLRLSMDSASYNVIHVSVI